MPSTPHDPDKPYRDLIARVPTMDDDALLEARDETLQALHESGGAGNPEARAREQRALDAINAELNTRGLASPAH